MRAPQRPATHEVRGPTVPVLRPVDELCLPLGEALRVLLLRVDTLLFAGHPNSVDEELRRVRMLATEALLALRRLKDEVDGAVVDGASLDEVLRHLTSRLRRQ